MLAQELPKLCLQARYTKRRKTGISLLVRLRSGTDFIDWMYEHQNAAGVVIDEIDKLKRNEQAMLYNFLESGQIDYETSKVTYHFKMEKCKVIATTNSLDRLSKNLSEN